MSSLRSFLFTFCSVASLVFSSHVHASGPSRPAEAKLARSGEAELSVSSILDKAIKAVGGRDALKSMKSVSSHAMFVHSTFIQDLYLTLFQQLPIVQFGRELYTRSSKYRYS